MEKQQDKKFTTKQNVLGFGKATAAAAINSLNAYVFDEDEDVAIVKPYMTSHFNVQIGNLPTQWDDVFAGTVKGVIADVMANYFVAVDPTTLENVYRSLKSVLVTSINLYSLVCTVLKCQNGRNLEDERKIKLGQMFFMDGSVQDNVIPNREAVLTNYLYSQKNDLQNKIWCAYSISNSDWATNVLEGLQHCYLSESLRNTCEFLFTQVFKCRRDDATVRFMNFWPQYFFDQDIDEKQGLFDTVKLLANNIDKEIQAYPFLTEVLSILGITKGSKFDFTRDLKGMSISIYDDFYGDIETMVYSLSSGFYIGVGSDSTVATQDCVVSEPEFTAHFKNNEFSYPDRVEIDVTSLTNALRGNIKHSFMTFIEVGRSDSANTINVTDYAGPLMAPIVIKNLNGNSMESAIALYYLNSILRILDAPSGHGLEYVNGGENSWKYNLQGEYGLADYVINAGDYFALRAQASYDLTFADSTDIRIEKYKTLTNNSVAVGNNSSN